MVKTFSYAIALTGSIATGKSSVVSILSSLGFIIIDADKIAHKILDQEHKSIAKLFGNSLILDSRVDRKTLGKIIFSDIKKRRELESLLHPLIYQEIKREATEQDKFKKIYFIDIPLFFEKNNYPIEKSLVVHTSKEKQLLQLMKRDNSTEEEANLRINSQISIEYKIKKATYLIDNSGTLTELKKECKLLIEELI